MACAWGAVATPTPTPTPTAIGAGGGAGFPLRRVRTRSPPRLRVGVGVGVRAGGSTGSSAYEFATVPRIVFGQGEASPAKAAALAAGLRRDASSSSSSTAAAGGGRAVVFASGSASALGRAIAAELEAVHATPCVFVPVGRGEPTVASVEACVGLCPLDAAVCVAIGGGAAIDTAKAVAAVVAHRDASSGRVPDVLDFLEVVGRGVPLTLPSVPLLAIPTTAGPGAEVTRNAVLDAGGQKVSLRSALMLPRVALVDPLLTLSLPRAATAHTGLDALTQCIEPYVSCAANPVASGLALEGVRQGARGIRAAFAAASGALGPPDAPEAVAARDAMCQCSLLGGLALANAKLGAVHGFAGVLGGALGAPHGAVCAALLPHVCRANVAALRAQAGQGDAGGADAGVADAERFLQRYQDLAAIVTGDPAARPEQLAGWCDALVVELGVPGLASFGLARAAIPDLARASGSTSSMKGNPVAFAQAELEAILVAAL